MRAEDVLVMCPAGILHHEIAHEADAEAEGKARHIRCDKVLPADEPHPPATNLILPAEGVAIVERLSIGRPGPLVNRPDGRKFVGGKASVRVVPIAGKLARVEIAAEWIAQDAILDPVRRITGGANRAGKRRTVGSGEERLREVVSIRIDMPDDVDLRDDLPGEVVSRRPRDDGIEVFRIALGRLKGHAPAIGAAGEIGPLRGAAVAPGNDGLGHLRHAMAGNMAVIDDPLEVAERPACIGPLALVARIRAGRCVALLKCAERIGLIVDPSGIAAYAAHHEPPVPALGQPDREADLAPDHPLQPAMGYRRSCILCRDDPDVRKGKPREVGTCHPARRLVTARRPGARDADRRQGAGGRAQDQSCQG